MSVEGLEIRKARSFYDHARCVQIRTLAFVVGRKVPLTREVDEFEDTSFHYLAMVEGEPVGTARWRWYGVDGAKIERVAVLDEWRGRKIGAALVRYAMRDIQGRQEITQILLAAQDDVIGFYESFGFRVVGDGYIDGGLPHHDMTMDLKQKHV